MQRLAGREGIRLDEAAIRRIRALMPGLKERAKTLAELADAAAFLARRAPLPFDAKAAALLTPENRTLLGEVGAALGEDGFLGRFAQCGAAGLRRAKRAQARPGGAAAPGRA